MILKILAVVLITIFSLKFIQIILATKNIVDFVQTSKFWYFLIMYLVVIGVGFLLKKVDDYGEK